MKFSMGNAQELLVDDLELLQREINDFCASNGTGVNEIPKILENYLLYVAKTGNTVFPWQHIRSLFRYKLQSSIATFSGEPMSMEGTVYERFDLFRAAPFTIQRFSELITDPKKHYKFKEKYLFALEKAVFVVSTVEPSSLTEEEVNGTNENSVSENEVSYHELNSTFSVTPSDAENLSVVGDVASSYPTVPGAEIPVLPPVISDIEIQAPPLELETADEMMATVDTEPVQETEVLDADKKVQDNSVDEQKFSETAESNEEKIPPQPEPEDKAGAGDIVYSEVPQIETKLMVEESLTLEDDKHEVEQSVVIEDETAVPALPTPAVEENGEKNENNIVDESAIAEAGEGDASSSSELEKVDDVEKMDFEPLMS